MGNIVFKGIMPAIITPYGDDGKVKSKTAAELVNWHLDSGVTGFYVCGGTGEGPVLTKEARMEMAEAVIDANNSRGKVLVHVGAFNSKEAIELTRHATKIGADGISSLPPNFYYDYSDDEIYDYYKTLAENTDLPVLMYATTTIKSKDINMLLRKMMEIDNIVGIKDTRRNYHQMWQAKQINDGDINVVNGPDEMLICGLSMGADGGIGSTYNVMPEKFVELYDCFIKKDIKGAQKMQTEINKIVDVLIKYGVINAVKCALTLKGFESGNAAYPSRVYTKEQISSLKSDLEKAGYKF
jgi:N-acetylneuraminate lyase